MLKNVFVIVGVVAFWVTGCSTTPSGVELDRLGDKTGLVLSQEQQWAAIINAQHSAEYLPEWLRHGESGCTDGTYCAIECAFVDSKRDDYFLIKRYADNLARGKLLGYMKAAIRLYDEGLTGLEAASRSQENANYIDSVVQGYAYGIRNPDSAYRSTLDKLEVCSLAVFEPGSATSMLAEYSKIAGLDLNAQELEAHKKRFLSKKIRDRAMRRFNADQESSTR